MRKFTSGIIIVVVLAAGIASGALILSASSNTPISSPTKTSSSSGTSSSLVSPALNTTQTTISSQSSTSQQSLDTTQTTTSSQSSTSQQCGSNFPHGLQLSQNNNDSITSQSMLAFIANPGATVAFCVTYTIAGNVSASFLNAYIWQVNTTALHNSHNATSGYTYSYSSPEGINISSNAAAAISLSRDEGSTKVTIVYTITSAPNATGFYDFAYLNNCPPFTPFAVTTSQSVNASSFPGFFLPSSCHLEIPESGGTVSAGVITGYTNLSTEWLSVSTSQTAAVP